MHKPALRVSLHAHHTRTHPACCRQGCSQLHMALQEAPPTYVYCPTLCWSSLCQAVAEPCSRPSFSVGNVKWPPHVRTLTSPLWPLCGQLCDRCMTDSVTDRRDPSTDDGVGAACTAEVQLLPRAGCSDRGLTQDLQESVRANRHLSNGHEAACHARHSRHGRHRRFDGRHAHGHGQVGSHILPAAADAGHPDSPITGPAGHTR
ncbi:hypothetical protein V8C86DRAFT_2782045 [Haematococcus lacustris]